MTVFTEKTQEELIQGLINMVDPELVGFNRTMMVSGLYTEEGPKESHKLRNGKYYRAPITFAYWDGDEDVDYEEISREEFLSAIRASYEGFSLAMLRASYLSMEYNQYLIRRIKQEERIGERIRQTCRELTQEAEKLDEVLAEKDRVIEQQNQALQDALTLVDSLRNLSNL